MAIPITAEMRAHLAADNQQVIQRIDVMQNGQVITSDLPATSGSVTISSTNAARRTCTVIIDGDNGSLVPASPSDLLAPFGNELVLQRGLLLPSGPQLIPVGVFRLDKSNPTTSGGAVPITLNGTDRSAIVAAAKYTDYVTLPAGMTGHDRIMAIISPVLPSFQIYNFVGDTAVLAAQTFAPGDDRWAKAQAVASDIGCLLYFDPRGICVLIPVPDLASSQPVWDLSPGPSSVLLQAAQTLDRTQAVNWVVATAQGSGVAVPLRSEAKDTDPSSPTYVNGPFGAQVLPIQSSTITTQADLDNLAASQLKLFRGVSQQATVSTLALPQVDAFDVITASIPRVGIAGRFAVDSVTLDLMAGPMSLATRGALFV